jgi:hypothetical protein
MRGMEIQLQMFLTSELDGERSALRTGHFTLGISIRGWVVLRWVLEAMAKTLVPDGNRTPLSWLSSPKLVAVPTESPVYSTRTWYMESDFHQRRECNPVTSGDHRQCREVAGSIPDEVFVNINQPNLSRSTMTLGSTQPLTEMSTRNLPGREGVKGRPARKPDLTDISASPVLRNFDVSQPLGPLRYVTSIILPHSLFGWHRIVWQIDTSF